MEPTLKSGDIVWVNNWAYVFKKPRIGDIVVFKKSDKELIKRITTISGSGVFLSGDNKTDSYDSRNFGKISNTMILGKVIIKSNFI